jgi:hypothetical protein
MANAGKDITGLRAPREAGQHRNDPSAIPFKPPSMTLPSPRFHKPAQPHGGFDEDRRIGFIKIPFVEQEAWQRLLLRQLTRQMWTADVKQPRRGKSEPSRCGDSDESGQNAHHQVVLSTRHIDRAPCLVRLQRRSEPLFGLGCVVAVCLIIGGFVTVVFDRLNGMISVVLITPCAPCSALPTKYWSISSISEERLQ